LSKIPKESVEGIEDKFRGLDVLVTGGAGFIGSWIAEALIDLGAKVTVLDNLSTGSVKNVERLIGTKGFRFLEGDVSKLEIGRYDCIIHAAALPSPDIYVKRPVETMVSNSLGTFRVLEASRRYDGLVLYTSTSEVYGDAELIPTPETYWGRVNPVGVRACYDESKRFGEALCMAYHRQYGIDVRVARIFNTYGPRLDPNAKYARVIPRFIIQALKNEPITIHGDGKQTRSFCYISDTVNALLRMLSIDGLGGEVINVGSQREVSILELAKLIRRLVGSNSKFEFQPPRPDDPRRRCPDISKAKRLLGWEPKVSLEEGLTRTIEWFKHELQNR